MMKTKTINLYVSNKTFGEITKLNRIKQYGLQFHYSLKPEEGTNNQIQISWQEPEREVTLTESQLEAKLAKIAVKHYAGGPLGENVFTINGIKQDLCGVEDLKQELFGEEK